jgi:hypothetical protein
MKPILQSLSDAIDACDDAFAEEQKSIRRKNQNLSLFQMTLN